MKVSKFSERQIAVLLKQVYDGVSVEEVRRLKQLEDKNQRLKQMAADLPLDKAMWQDVLSKRL